MAISGINGISRSYYTYQSDMNQIRLQQALRNNTRYQQTIQPVDKINSSYNKSSMDFLKEYNSTMSDLMQSSNALRQSNNSGVLNQMTVSSSDQSVAEATQKYKVRNSKEITVDVAQIAAAQENASSGIKASDIATESMDFSVTDGTGNSVSVQVNMVKDDGTGKTNREMLKEAAAQINQANTGVKAVVVEKDGVSNIQLQGKETGARNSFEVSGDMGAAQGLENVSKSAQDAVYSVTEGNTTREYQSASNSVSVDYARIGLNLKSAGKTTIAAQPDAKKVVSAVEDLVGSYNQALKVLNDNADRGSGVMNQLRSMVNGLSSEQTLGKLGISTKKDGTLVLDKSVLEKNLKENPEFTKEVLGGNYSVAQTGFQKASSAMRANAASLISNDLKELEQDVISDPFNFMNMYSRTGAYNMSNYNALGLMMNYLV